VSHYAASDAPCLCRQCFRGPVYPALLLSPGTASSARAERAHEKARLRAAAWVEKKKNRFAVETPLVGKD
jgi:hypothetical protein